MFINSSGEVSIDAQAKTQIAFARFGFVRLGGRPGHQGWFPLKKMPEAGLQLKALASINGIKFIQQIEQFQLRGFDGSLMASFTSDEVNRSDETEEHLFTSFTVPENQLRIYAVGIDNQGFPFQRQYSHSIKGRPSTKDNIDAEDEYGVTALFNATYDNDMSKVQELIDAGADVNHLTNNGVTAVMYAVVHQDCAILEILLERGADVNAINKHSSTAVFKATVANNALAVQMLLARGADPNIRDGSGYTAAEWTQKQNYANILTLLQPYAGDMTIEVAPVETQ